MIEFLMRLLAILIGNVIGCFIGIKIADAVWNAKMRKENDRWNKP